jgi:tetratricopeptide (TPR) repeat protein
LIARLSGELANPEQTQPENRACNYYGRGLLYQLQGDTQKAIDDYTSAIGWMESYANVYAARGDAYEDLGQHDAALRDYAESLRRLSHPSEELHERCWIRALRGRPLELALKDCNESLQLRPKNSGTLASRGLVQLRMANYPAAISDCDAALRMDQRNEFALFIRAVAKSRSGDTPGASADLSAAKDVDRRIDETFAIFGVKM